MGQVQSSDVAEASVDDHRQQSLSPVADDNSTQPPSMESLLAGFALTLPLFIIFPLFTVYIFQISTLRI